MIKCFFDIITIIITGSICCLIILSITELLSNTLGGKCVFSLLKMTMLSFVLPLHKFTDKAPNLLFLSNSVYPNDLAMIRLKLVFQNILIFISLIFVIVSAILIICVVRQQREEVQELMDYSVSSTNKKLLNMAAELSSQIGLKEKIRIYSNPDVSGAVLVGIRNPIVILSADIYKKEDYRYLLLHELYHYKRHHTLYKTLATLLRCVLWFNPLATELSKGINTWSELACDEDAVAHLNRRERKAYANLIVDCSKRNPSGYSYVTMFSSAPNLQRRIKNIMTTKKSIYKKVGASLLTIALLSMSFIPAQAASSATVAIQDKAANVAFGTYTASDDLASEVLNETTMEGPDLSDAPIVENLYTRGPISSTVKAGYTISSKAHTMSIGQTVTVAFNTNVTGKFTVGLLQPDGMARIVTTTANGFGHTFAIAQNGTHYIYITNNSSGAMTFVGTIYWG